MFVVSWVNPDARHAKKGFEAYMREGVLAALDAIEQATGERDVAAIAYCVGGTLLAATLGAMAATGDERISSATLLATQIDFTDAGDLKVFVDAEQLKAIERKMEKSGGFLEGAHMANAFNMLRPDELIWSYFVNNYLKGKEPMPFDLLVWNANSARMPAANHHFYLRHCYLQNDLANGRMKIGGRRVNLSKVKIPVYELAARDDHIAPARSVFTGAKTLGGPVRFVLAGSGHVAGVVNPPAKMKYQHWTGGPPQGDFDAWLAAAQENPGSWWPDWLAWLTAQAPERGAGPRARRRPARTARRRARRIRPRAGLGAAAKSLAKPVRRPYKRGKLEPVRMAKAAHSVRRAAARADPSAATQSQGGVGAAAGRRARPDDVRPDLAAVPDRRRQAAHPGRLDAGRRSAQRRRGAARSRAGGASSAFRRSPSFPTPRAASRTTKAARLSTSAISSAAPAARSRRNSPASAWSPTSRSTPTPATATTG